MGLGDLGQNRRLLPGPPEQGRPADRLDALAVAIRPHFPLGIPGMGLQLVANRLGQALGGQVFQLVDQKIGDAHLARLALLLHLQKRLICPIAQRRIHPGPMEQHRVHILQAQAAEPVLGVPFGVGIILGPQLGGHVDLLPGDAAVPDGLTHQGFVPIDLGAVHMPVADLQRIAHRVVYGVPRLIYPQPNGGKLQCHCRSLLPFLLSSTIWAFSPGVKSLPVNRGSRSAGQAPPKAKWWRPDAS